MVKMYNLDIDAWRFASVLFSLLDLSISYFPNYSKFQVLLSLKFFPWLLFSSPFFPMVVSLEGGLLRAW